MKLSTAFVATLRDNPRDADTISLQLMMRSGMIRKHAAGIYSYLPLLVRSYNKLLQIMREEFDHIGWQEIVMPFVIPSELWKESGRWNAYGKELLRIKDRKDNEFCLGPTHEEVVTDLVRSQVSSYKQLPLALYQMTTKFRDEIRPRFGLMRGREFEMMDGYSFHPSREDLDQHYEAVAKAYGKIFERAGLKYLRVEADTGAIGGSGSHEFHVLAGSGEDAIFSCASCGYGANLEKAETPAPEKQKKDWGTATSKGLSEVSTPTQKTIEAVSQLLNVPTHRNIKTLVYRYLTAEEGAKWKPVVAFTLGHRQLNEVKLKVALSQSGLNIVDLSTLPETQVAELFGSPVGFLGPIGAPEGIPLFFDREIIAAHDVVMGANKEGFHLQNVEPTRDIKTLTDKNLRDLVSVVKGDACPRCATGVYDENRGIEVGHIFKLGTKYSKPMNAVFQDAQKATQVIEMGTYGIGITRVIAACIEQNYDADGIIWPDALAPFKVEIVCLAPDDKECATVADSFYEELRHRKVEVLYDDRMDLSPGVKFKDADLLGVPLRLVIGKKGIAAGEVEFSRRKDKKKEMLKFERSDSSAARTICDRILA